MESEQKELSEYQLDFVNYRSVSSECELTLTHNPISYDYKGSVYAGTGSKNRHRWEKVIITWKRKFPSAKDAEHYLESIGFESRFDSDAYAFVPPLNSGFKAMSKVRLGKGWRSVVVHGGSLTIEEEYYIEDNT